MHHLPQVGLTHDLRQGVALQVEQDASRLQAGPQLKQAVEGQRGHVRLAPSLPSLLHLLFELHPPAETQSGFKRAANRRVVGFNKALTPLVVSTPGAHPVSTTSQPLKSLQNGIQILN